MRKCTTCGEAGHNARTCTAKLDKAKAAERLQTIITVKEPLTQRIPVITTRPPVVLTESSEEIPDSVLDDWSFWTWEQREKISKELIAYRRNDPSRKKILAL